MLDLEGALLGLSLRGHGENIGASWSGVCANAESRYCKEWNEELKDGSG
jgi:hypothetical protein